MPTLDGLHYEEAGAGEPVVLVHSAVADSRMWDAQVDAFAPSRRVVRFDMRGFGRSQLEPGTVSFRGDLLALLDGLELQRAALVGNSMGGRAALELAVEHPERVSALVLVDVLLPGREDSPEVAEADAAEDEALERGDVEAAVEVNVRTWVVGSRRPDAVDPAVREAVAAMQRRAFELQLPLGDSVGLDWLDPPVNTRLADVRAPTLVIVGDADVRDAHESADELERGIRGARRTVIRDAAHLPSLERPDEFNRLVLGFLADVT